MSTNILKEGKARDMVLPALAMLLSLISLASIFYWPLNIPKIILAVIGMLAGISFFMGRQRWFFVLIQVWIYGQFPAIARETSIKQQGGSIYVQEQPLLDAGQVFKYSVGIAFTEYENANRKLILHLNLVPFALLILFRLLRSRSLVGRAITIKQFRKDNKLGKVFPLQGRASRVVTLGTEKHWLLVDLDTPFEYGGTSIAHLLIRDKEGLIYKPGKAGRVSYLVLVPNPYMIQETGNRKEQFQFIDWGLVSVAW